MCMDIFVWRGTRGGKRDRESDLERERERVSHLKLLALGLLMVPSSSVMTKLLQLESV